MSVTSAAEHPYSSGAPLPLAVTMGDPAGIGPDITLVSWSSRTQQQLPPFAIYADPDVLRARARALSLKVSIEVLGSIGEAAEAFHSALPVLPLGLRCGGSGDNDAAVTASIETATAAAAGGQALALVTNPIAKRTLQAAKLKYPGHTELLGVLAARHFKGRKFQPVMLLAAAELKVVPTTVHIPLAAVPRVLSPDLLRTTIRIARDALTADFGIGSPRIAVTGLNPHAGESGLIGEEEAKIISPVIAQLAAEGFAITGPHAADALFHAEARQTYDVAVAMYHDQALIPLKTLAFDRGVNVTLGLPFVRTSPDHGTAIALAGTGKARPGSFIAALRLAAQLGARRAAAQASPRP